MWSSDTPLMRKGFLLILPPLFLSVLSLIPVWLNTYNGGTPDRSLPDTLAVENPVIRFLYGLPTDSFIISTGTVSYGTTLAGLFAENGISATDIHHLMEKSKGIPEAAKIKAGNTYLLFQSKDSLQKLEYFIYENDPVSYTVFRFSDSLHVWTGAKEIDTTGVFFAGAINTSLWDCFESKGADPMMAVELSEIYAWTIDFFGLQQGDSLRVYYDEYYVDSVRVGTGMVHGAWFRHMGRDFWAIPFVQDGTLAFYDEKGHSLRKAFLKAPLRFSRISSRYSGSRMHPILKIRRPHLGVDYAAPAGTPVSTIGDGVVIRLENTPGAGNMVKIKHNSVYTTAYLHLSRYAKGIKQGAFVKQGDVIGYVGSTGLSTGPHLDFRFYKNGQPVDPLKVEAPPVEPVRGENESDFAIRKDSIMQLISEN